MDWDLNTCTMSNGTVSMNHFADDPLQSAKYTCFDDDSVDICFTNIMIRIPFRNISYDRDLIRYNLGIYGYIDGVLKTLYRVTIMREIIDTLPVHNYWIHYITIPEEYTIRTLHTPVCNEFNLINNIFNLIIHKQKRILLLKLNGKPIYGIKSDEFVNMEKLYFTVTTRCPNLNMSIDILRKKLHRKLCLQTIIRKYMIKTDPLVEYTNIYKGVRIPFGLRFT